MSMRFLVAGAIVLVFSGCGALLAIEDVTYAPADDGAVPLPDARDETPMSPDANADADASSPGSPPDAGRDSGIDCAGFRLGTAMVLIGVAAGNDYCIDSTEVTTAQYKHFLSGAPPNLPQRPECAWNTSFNPADLSLPDNYPITSVDWCDAVAYCAWVGKRLCGRIGGGSVTVTSYGTSGEFRTPSVDQWYRACSAAGFRAFPYGNDFDASACNALGHFPDGGQPATGVLPVGSVTTCQGGYPGIFDMSGNAFEWEDACESYSDGGLGVDASAVRCAKRGYYWYPPGNPGVVPVFEAACATVEDDPVNPNKGTMSPRYQQGAGFRCCAP